jgi:class 3 adenylate cyclase/predicted ATPase
LDFTGAADFVAVVDQVIALLRQRGRVTYRTLQLQFQLDDTHLEVLKDELIEGQRLATDEAGRVLVWTGGAETPPPTLPPSVPQVPQPATPEEAFLQATPLPAALSYAAERRQLTVLFCDLVDSTRLARRFDPEDWREMVRAYQEACATVIQRFDGYIAQYLGDGLLVYFGYPQAHEDDARRAVHTGLAMLEAMRQLNIRLAQERGVQLIVRVGIHTGLVVVGEMGGGGRHERLALGDTPNLAARLQGLAEPDTVVMSAATMRLVEGYVRCTDLGPQSFKGVDTPVAVYRVLGEGTAQSRLEGTAAHGWTPLVGREAEVALLRERWAQVTEGRGQVILVQGEAGIGKSRLVQVLTEHVAETPHTALECRGSPYHQHSALYPVIGLWQRAWQFAPGETPVEKLGKLETALARSGLPIAQTVPLLAALLSLPLPPDRYAPSALAPQQQKQKTLEALLVLLLELTAQQPVLLIVEDLHWIDPSTLEWLSLLLDQVPTTRLGLLMTARPDFQVPWSARAYLTQLTLGRFARPQVRQMVEGVTGGKRLPVEVVQQIVTKADGVPLFVEELTKTILEAGWLQEQEDHYALTELLPPLAIPATLQDALMARLDRLGEGKAVAQLGAVLGRTFTHELLRAVASLDELAVWRGLGQLVKAEVLYQHGVPPQATYIFKHALLQDMAYQSVLRSTRQQYHQRIAQMLEARFAETIETQPELLAHHYTAAGLREQAMGYWQRAGQRAYHHSAYVEAISHFTQGLEVLKTMPETIERRRQELGVQTTLGQALAAVKGLAAPEVEAVYQRARMLCQQVGETPQLLGVLYRLGILYNNRGQYQVARELGEQALRLAQQVHDPVGIAHAHLLLGNTSWFLGELDVARTHIEQNIGLYIPQQYRAHGLLGETHFEVFCRCRLARILWSLGYPDQALQRSQEALKLARETSHPMTLAVALLFAATLYQYRREGHLALEWSEAALALSHEQGFAQRLAEATIQRGWGLVEQGQEEAGIAQIRQGLAALRVTGVGTSRSYMGLLAEAYGKAGQPEAGLRVVGEVLASSNRPAQGTATTELYRLQGELLLRQTIPDAPQAEASFQQALAMARRQQAKSLELRAAMSLARLWRQQGKQAKARALLAPIYGWFTEGFDTADLQEAKTLLEELGG